MQTPLVLTLLGLLFLLIALVFIYVWVGRSRDSNDSIEPIETFESLSAVIRKRSSSRAELYRAVGMLLESFGVISPHTLPTYQSLMQSLCVHPRADSKIVLRFERTLRQINPKYDSEIEHALRAGLAARG